MPWTALVFEAEAAEAERLSDALLEAGAASVSLEPAAPQGDALAPSACKSGRSRERLTALLHPSRQAHALLAEACARAGVAPLPPFRTELVADEDWLARSRAQFGPMRAGERIWVVPSWCEPPDAAALVLRLDPGLAFGTGSHPSTRLALAWLERELRGGERVLDYGCGSGILAIAAARLGAARVHAIDLDPVAIDLTRENAQRNDVAVEVRVPEELGADRYDVVVANILARPLVALAPLFAAHTAAGARVALSGILEPQAAEVIAAYRDVEFDLAVRAREEGWILVAGVRR